MFGAPDQIPLPIPCRPRSGSGKFRCRPASKISPKKLISLEFLQDERGISDAEIEFLPAGREARGAAVGWHGDPKLPILAASDIISRLGMRLPSNRDVVRPDPDVA